MNKLRISNSLLGLMLTVMLTTTIQSSESTKESAPTFFQKVTLQDCGIFAVAVTVATGIIQFIEYRECIRRLEECQEMLASTEFGCEFWSRETIRLRKLQRSFKVRRPFFFNPQRYIDECVALSKKYYEKWISELQLFVSDDSYTKSPLSFEEIGKQAQLNEPLFPLVAIHQQLRQHIDLIELRLGQIRELQRDAEVDGFIDIQNQLTELILLATKKIELYKAETIRVGQLPEYAAQYKEKHQLYPIK
jgi:hypothetical protein